MEARLTDGQKLSKEPIDANYRRQQQLKIQELKKQVEFMRAGTSISRELPSEIEQLKLSTAGDTAKRAEAYEASAKLNQQALRMTLAEIDQYTRTQEKISRRRSRQNCSAEGSVCDAHRDGAGAGEVQRADGAGQVSE